MMAITRARRQARAQPARVDDPYQRLAQLDERLANLLEAATRRLPPGWVVQLLPLPPGAVLGSPLAIEFRLSDPRHHVLPPLQRDTTGPAYDAYRRFIDRLFEAQYEIYPELGDQLAWGGRFTDAAGNWRLGYIDLAGWRGRGDYERPPKKPPPSRRPRPPRRSPRCLLAPGLALGLGLVLQGCEPGYHVELILGVSSNITTVDIDNCPPRRTAR